MPEENEHDGMTKAYKDRKPVALLAAFGLMAIAAGSVGGIVYDLVINGNPQSLTTLGTLATLTVGALVALAGGRANGDK